MSTTQATVALVQLDMFSRGSAIESRFVGAVATKPNYKKDKNKRLMLDGQGQPIVTSRTIKLLPTKSKEHDDLADLTGLKGQELQVWRAAAEQALLESGAAHFTKLVASGNYTFKLARDTARGDFVIALKLANGKARILSPEELDKQAGQLGYKLVPIETPKPETTPDTEPGGENGEAKVEVDKAKKSGKAKAKGKTVNIETVAKPAAA